jgi:predicted transcriptional regulator of viral defense system
MGKEKYQRKIEELFQKSPVVSIGSIKRVINERKKIKQYTKQLIRNLLLNGKIKKLGKGFYTSRGDPSLIVFCFKQSYLGLQDALSKHGLWEQETIPVVISSDKIRQGIRIVNGSNVLIKRIDKKYFFGIEYQGKEEEVYLPYSDIEKTLIDMVYFRQKLSEEALRNIKKLVNKKKLISYLNKYKYPKRIRSVVLDLIENKRK